MLFNLLTALFFLYITSIEGRKTLLNHSTQNPVSGSLNYIGTKTIPFNTLNSDPVFSNNNLFFFALNASETGPTIVSAELRCKNGLRYYRMYYDYYQLITAPYRLYLNSNGVVETWGYNFQNNLQLYWIQNRTGVAGTYTLGLEDDGVLNIKNSGGTVTWSCYEGVFPCNPNLCQAGCAGNPCQNGQPCVANGSNYTCNCTAGYNGTNCENNWTGCNSNPCQNSASCTPSSNGKYTCGCPSGFNGTNCENNFSGCLSNPCQNGAKCLASNEGKYTCSCTEGVNGTNCENNYSGCLSNPCQNNASCTVLLNSFSCNCTEGYSGKVCSVLGDPCSSTPCQNGDPCLSAPCQNGGSCSSVEGVVTCSCTEKFSGVNCEIDNSKEENGGGISTTTIIIIAAAAGGGLLLILVAIAICVFVSKNRRSRSKNSSIQMSNQTPEAESRSSGMKSPAAARSHDEETRSRSGTMNPAVDPDPDHPYDVFISYRVRTDQTLAERIYYALKSKKIYGREIRVYMDAFHLEAGENWEEGFKNGLKSSKVFVPLLTRDGLEGIRNLTPERKDNVLQEYEIALEEREKRNYRIIPFLVSEVDNSDGSIRKFREFDLNLYPAHNSITCPSRSIQQTMKMIFDLQGIFVTPTVTDLPTALDKLVISIEKPDNNRTSIYRSSVHD